MQTWRSQACAIKFLVCLFIWYKCVSPLLTIWADIQLDQENLKRKNEELIQTVREKSRKQLQTQELYDKLKQREMLGQVQNAAYEAVDTNIQTSGTASHITDRVDDYIRRPAQSSLFSNLQDSGTHLLHLSPNKSMTMGHVLGRSDTGDWAGFPSSQRGPARRCSSNKFRKPLTCY